MACHCCFQFTAESIKDRKLNDALELLDCLFHSQTIQSVDQVFA